MRLLVIRTYNGNLRVHRAGCRDAARDVAAGCNHWTITPDPGQSAYDAVYQDQLEVYYGEESPARQMADEADILPCTKGS